MHDTLLVPVDETAQTTRLLERAIELAETWTATVHVLSVVDGPTALAAASGGRHDRVDGAQERARRATMRATERVRRAGLEATGAVRRGIAHAEIVAEARSMEADVVLLGPPGRRTTDGPLCSGQVTSHVVDRADCAVLVEPVDPVQATDPTEPVETTDPTEPVETERSSDGRVVDPKREREPVPARRR